MCDKFKASGDSRSKEHLLHLNEAEAVYEQKRKDEVLRPTKEFRNYKLWSSKVSSNTEIELFRDLQMTAMGA